MTAFWDKAQRNLVEVDQSFRGTYRLHQQGYELFIALMVEAVRMSETSVYFNETTRRSIPESCLLHARRRENL
jgi:hypothetical protein